MKKIGIIGGTSLKQLLPLETKNHDEDALEEKEVVLISSLRGAVKRKM